MAVKFLCVAVFLASMSVLRSASTVHAVTTTAVQKPTTTVPYVTTKGQSISKRYPTVAAPTTKIAVSATPTSASSLGTSTQPPHSTAASPVSAPVCANPTNEPDFVQIQSGVCTAGGGCTCRVTIPNTCATSNSAHDIAVLNPRLDALSEYVNVSLQNVIDQVQTLASRLKHLENIVSWQPTITGTATTTNTPVGSDAPPEDVCSNFTVLSDSWRKVGVLNNGVRCDHSLITAGIWYRFMPPAGIRIPEVAPPVNSCGTHAPMWMNGTHPTSPSQGVVSRQLCANWGVSICNWYYYAEVALCPGGYYIYKASQPIPNICSLAWCAE